MVVEDYITDRGTYNTTGWHTGFGNHHFECYVDVSDTPRTFIYYEHYNDRNLQDFIDVEDDSSHRSEWKDF